MTDRHKVKPMSLRFPAALSAWLRQHAEATGRPMRQIVLRAVEEYRAKHDPPGEDQRTPVSELLGADPDWCDGQSVDEFVREQRR